MYLTLTSLNCFSGKCLQVFISLAVSLSIMSDAMSVGWTAIKIAEISTPTGNSTTEMNLQDASLIGTLPAYAVIFGVPVATYSANYIGRKWTIICGGSLTFLSWMVLCIADQIEIICLAVFLRGVGAFILYTITQVYIAEIAQANIRGMLSSFVPIMMNLGILASYVCVMYMGLKLLAVLSCVICALMFPCLIWAPKSPYYLFMKKLPNEAGISLTKLRSPHKDINKELDDIKTTVEKDSLEKGHILEFITNKQSRKALFITLTVQMFQQFAGIDTILLFLKVILDSSNSNISIDLSIIIFGIMKFFSCGISLILMDHVGRKPLLIMSCFLTGCALLLIGSFFYCKDILSYNMSSVSWLPLVLMLFYILCYNFGLGIVPFVLSGEMFPTKFKAVGVAATQIMYAVSMIAITQLVAWLKDNYGFYLAFWILAINSFVGYVFCIIFVIETKCKSLKEIQNEM